MKDDLLKDSSSSSVKQEKKYNYFYKITNKLNGNYYYGVHCTDDLNDGYFGSGSALNLAVKKYGKGNFEKENLKFFSTAEEAFNYEGKIVDEKLLKDPKCYNLVPGGGGKFSIGRATVRDKNGNYFIVDKNDPRYITREVVPVSTGRIHMFKKFDDGFHNKYVLPEDIEKYKNDGWKEGTPNQGKVWINLTEEGTVINRKMVNEEEVEIYLEEGWSRGSSCESSTISGMIYIYRILDDGNYEKTYVLPEKLDEYLSKGWIEGCEQKGKKRIHFIHEDGTEEVKTVLKEEYNDYLSKGWKPGYCEDHSRFATQTGRKKIYKYENDGSLRVLSVHSEEVKYYEDNGWKLGTKFPNKLGLQLMSKRENKIVDQIYVPSTLIDTYLLNGWRRGKIK